MRIFIAQSQVQRYITVAANSLHKHFTSRHTVVQRDQLQLRFRNFHHIGKVSNETAHAITAVHAYFHHLTKVFGIVHTLQSTIHCIKSGSNARHRIVDFMRNHANHLFVSLLFGLHHFGGQTFYQDKRMRKSPVYKRKTRTTINHGVTQTNRLAGIFRYALYLFRQRRSKFTKQTSLHFIVCHIIQITERGSINHGDMSVKSQNDQSHRRYADQQIKKMILLAQAQSFVFQLFHHAVEYKHNAVGFLLPHRSEATAEILFAE